MEVTITFWGVINDRLREHLQILKGSDDGVQHSELLGFRTLSIVWYSKKTREPDISETGCFRPQVRSDWG
jgi:hypothetical protein